MPRTTVEPAKYRALSEGARPYAKVSISLAKMGKGQYFQGRVKGLRSYRGSGLGFRGLGV